jgi:Ethanolamine utilization protein EutJ (predicted chaperonin)
MYQHEFKGTLDTVKRLNLKIMDTGGKKIILNMQKKIAAENLLELRKQMLIQIQGALRTIKQIKPGKNIYMYTHKGRGIMVITDLSTETLRSRRD